MRILIIEDNPGIASNLYDFLESRGHEVESLADGQTGLGAAATGGFDALILDVRLPRLSGIDLCRRLRRDFKIDTPVLMLTAMDSLEDKLEGFEAGADDYLVKPFAMREVEARLGALVSRSRGRVIKKALQVGSLCYDPDSITVSVGGQTLPLAPKCIRLIAAMLENPRHTFSRAELERAGWGQDECRAETLRAHMSILRRALSDVGQPDTIQTLHGIGYRINPSLLEGGPESAPPNA